jgi:hypothetical protein
MTPISYYVGIADWRGHQVWLEQVDGRTPLRAGKRAAKRFAWGQAGQGAHELARSILRDTTGETDLTDTL